jgi:hypothetical protein
MSTKTTFKRIALVAVAALGFGMVSYVPVANAAGQTAASIVVGTVPSARVGATVSVPLTIYLPAASVENDTITVNIESTSSPILGGAANAASTFGSGTTGNATGQVLALDDASSATAISNPTIADNSGNTASADYGRLDPADRAAGLADAAGVVAATSGVYQISAADKLAGYISLVALVTPDVAGSYSFLVSANATGSTYYVAGHVNTSFTLTAGATAPTGVTLTPLAGSSMVAGSPNGVPVAVTLTGGTLAGLEGVTISASGNSAVSTSVTGGTKGTDITLSRTNFSGGATAIVWLRGTSTAAETVSLTASSTASASVYTTSRTFSILKQAGDATNVISIQSPTATSVYAANNVKVSSTTTYTVSTSSTSQKVGYTTPALADAAAVTASGTQGYVTVTDSLGLLTGVAGMVYDLPYSVAFGLTAAGGSLSFAANMSTVTAGTTAYTVDFPIKASTWVGPSAATTITFKAATPAADSFTITPSTSILAAPGAAIAFDVTVLDQFNGTLTNANVTATTTGRNNPAAKVFNTGATGTATFTSADLSTSTTNLVDTVTFTSGSATAGTVTINYGNTTVSTLTVTGGNTTASVNALTNTVNGISVGSSTAGVEAGAINITATVKDALGNALTGVPVSFTVAGTGVAFTTNTATVYTGSTGTAVGKLYAWTEGTYTYTVTAGGKTTTGTATFGSIAAGNARVISATVSGNVVTGKAVDRLGNPVQNAVLYASTSGGANIGGAFVATGTTLANGTVSWVVTGSGEVTVSAVNPSDPAGTTAYQTCALAGNRTCATATTAAAAYAATVAGTATTAEKHVGATFAPAGVASAKVTVAADTSTTDAATAAADAAAEATDAANAATDAANAAAEAADAATAAAQDAADAVAALSTQVSEMVDALKKQITALTNLVIKIQKKVKA